jgi:hypothetical protein
MPRGRNSIGTKKLHLSTTPEVLSALDALVQTGLFGKTRTEAAEELLRLKVRGAVTEGWLERSKQVPRPPEPVRARRK